jgi:hypothetical protein
MIEWAIFHKNFNLSHIPDFTSRYKIGNFNLVIIKNNIQGVILPDKDEGLFVFGYILPRLNTIIKGNVYENILEGLKLHGPQYILNFKGNFILIRFYDEKIFIINDHFGVSKYFFSGDGDQFMASNHISFIKKNRTLEISRKNILLYYLFNYFIEGTTVFNNCHYSTPASFHTLGSETFWGHYFSVKEFIDGRKIKYGKKESLKMAADLWKKIFQQYLNFFNNRRISQTITAGLDSRLILAGFRANNYNPSTFTFGRFDSMDVVHAKKVVRKLKLKHEHLYPDKSFFSNYSKFAKDVILRSSGMATLFRAHRLQAYDLLKANYNVLFFGFIGSETIRGLYPDGLLVPRIVSDYWLKGDFNLKEYFPANWFKFNEDELIDIKKEILNYEFFKRPDLLLFNVMIPLHFAQDIILNDTLNVFSLAPYWDIDLLEFQKGTEFFIENSRKEEFARLGHFNRKKGPYFSTYLIKILDKDNAKISLGKGYSPADYAFSMYYAAVRFAVYKTLFRKQYSIPNFDYEEWFKDYLRSYLNNNALSFINIDKQTLVRDIDNINGTDELSFLNHVKAINIDLILKEL